MVSIQLIRKTIEDKVGFSIRTNDRKRDSSDARALFYKLCRDYTLEVFSTIGAEVGRDHTTVIHGFYKVFPLTDQVLYTTVKREIEAWQEIYKQNTIACR